MIVCGKCGFTQPKDVYCANCGINIETYQPVKPPVWVTLIKDPYFQITSALIIALASFFIVINQPSQPLDPVASSSPEINRKRAEPLALEDENLEAPSKKQVATEALLKKQVKKKKAMDPTKIEKEPVAKAQSIATAENKTSETAEQSSKSITSSDEIPSESSEKETQAPIANISSQFYEANEIQLNNLFKSPSATVEVVVVDTSSLELQRFAATPLATSPESWPVSSSKNKVLNYMMESLDESPPKGIRFQFKWGSESSNSLAIENLNIRVMASIPSKKGVGASFDWARSFKVSSGQTALIKVKLPHFEVPEATLEDFYNTASPLSILSSPSFLELKTQLLGVVVFE